MNSDMMDLYTAELLNCVIMQPLQNIELIWPKVKVNILKVSSYITCT